MLVQQIIQSIRFTKSRSKILITGVLGFWGFYFGKSKDERNEGANEGISNLNQELEQDEQTLDSKIPNPTASLST